ncbi:MAG: hypothetical protein WAM09_00870 [Anaerolineales bacterium]
MRSPDRKIDASMQSAAKKWMKSLDRPRASTTLGYFFVGMFILFWSSSLTAMFGFNLKNGFGSLIFIGVGLSLTFATMLIIRFMARIGIDRPVRSAFMLSAVIGPYVNMAAYHAWNSPVISHIAGFSASILAFIVSILLDKLLERKPEQVY